MHTTPEIECFHRGRKAYTFFQVNRTALQDKIYNRTDPYRHLAHHHFLTTNLLKARRVPFFGGLSVFEVNFRFFSFHFISLALGVVDLVRNLRRASFQHSVGLKCDLAHSVSDHYGLM
jgi:hypothetical protein